MHDVWHLVAGYETTSSNEIAISAFQLAQFGHNYSAMFLAVGMAMSVTKEPRGFAIILQIIAEAWTRNACDDGHCLGKRVEHPPG